MGIFQFHAFHFDFVTASLAWIFTRKRVIFWSVMSTKSKFLLGRKLICSKLFFLIFYLKRSVNRLKSLSSAPWKRKGSHGGKKLATMFAETIFFQEFEDFFPQATGKACWWEKWCWSCFPLHQFSFESMSQEGIHEHQPDWVTQTDIGPTKSKNYATFCVVISLLS